VRAGTGESPLEVRFRAELIDRLGKEMAVRAVGDPSGAPALEIDGGRWRIRPQLDALGARPDFTCLRPAGRAPIAIFIDGRRYHATRAHNRLADDAAKRERLRAAGYRVIAVGAEDLGGPWNPAWLDDDAVARLKNGSLGPARAGAVTDRAIAAWCGGPVALLESMLLDDADDGPDASPEATALSLEGDQEAAASPRDTALALLADILVGLDRRVTGLINADGDPIASGLAHEATTRCITIGSRIGVADPTDPTGAPQLEGTATALSPIGTLVVLLDDGTTTDVSAGDVTPIANGKHRA